MKAAPATEAASIVRKLDFILIYSLSVPEKRGGPGQLKRPELVPILLIAASICKALLWRLFPLAPASFAGAHAVIAGSLWPVETPRPPKAPFCGVFGGEMGGFGYRAGGAEASMESQEEALSYASRQP